MTQCFRVKSEWLKFISPPHTHTHTHTHTELLREHGKIFEIGWANIKWPTTFIPVDFSQGNLASSSDQLAQRCSEMPFGSLPVFSIFRVVLKWGKTCQNKTTAIILFTGHIHLQTAERQQEMTFKRHLTSIMWHISESNIVLLLLTKTKAVSQIEGCILQRSQKDDHQFLWTQQDEVDEFDNRHSGFWRSWWLWTVITPLKKLATDAKKKKNRTRSEFFYDPRKFRRQCVNVIEIMCGCIYFSTCEHFGWTFRTQCP